MLFVIFLNSSDSVCFWYS